MKSIPNGILTRHDALVGKVREERAGSDPSETSISDRLAAEASAFIEELGILGRNLQGIEARDNALSLMSYWIHALYRGGYYQRQETNPPFPELEDYQRDRQDLTDTDYPWPRLTGEEPTGSELPGGLGDVAAHIWVRQAAEGAEILLNQGLLGVTGAAGAGRSHFIEHGLISAVLAKDPGLVVRRISPIDAFTSGATEDRNDVWFAAALAGLLPNPAANAAFDVKSQIEDPELLARLIREGGLRLLVVVHDLNRLFTQSENPDAETPSPGQKAFVDGLLSLATDPKTRHLVVVDLQRTYLGQLAMFPEFNARLEASGTPNRGEQAEPGVADGWLTINHQTPELRALIEAPADLVDLDLQCGLSERLVADHQGEPAAVPLLLFTLRRLWQDMLRGINGSADRNMLTWRNYKSVRSGRLALVVAANEALARVRNFGVHGERIAREVFSEMVCLLPGSRWWLDGTTRDAVLSAIQCRGELSGMGEGELKLLLDKVVDEFVSVGILTQVRTNGTSDPWSLKITHPALAEVWTPLIKWIEDDRETHRWSWRLKADALEWQRAADSKRWVEWYLLLWRGTRLKEAIDLSRKSAMAKRERDFLRASHISWLAARTALVLMLAAVVGALVTKSEILAGHMLSVHVERGASAEARGDVAQAAAWFGAASAPQADEPSCMISDHLPAFLRSQDSKQRLLVRQTAATMALDRFPEMLALAGPKKGMVTADLSEDGTLAVLGSRSVGDDPGGVLIWKVVEDPSAGSLRTLKLPKGSEVVSVKFLAGIENGKQAVAVGCRLNNGSKGWVGVWCFDEAGGEKTWKRSIEGPINDIAFRRVNFGKEGDFWVLAVGSGGYESRGRFDLDKLLPKRANLKIYFLNPQSDGSLYDKQHSCFSNPDELISRVVIAEDGAVAFAKLSIASSTSRISISRYNGNDRWHDLDIEGTVNLPVTDLAFAGRSDTLAAAASTPDGTSGILWLAQQEGDKWTTHPTPRKAGVTRVLFSPGGNLLASTETQGRIAIWQPRGAKAGDKLWEMDEGGWTRSAAWSPDGRWLATGNRDRHLRIWDVMGQTMAFPPLHHGETIGTIAFSKDGLNLMSATWTWTRIWSTQPHRDPILPWAAVGKAPLAAMSADGSCAVVLDEHDDPVDPGIRARDLKVWKGSHWYQSERNGSKAIPKILRASTISGPKKAAKEIPDPSYRIIAPSGDGKRVAAIRMSDGRDWLHVWDTESGIQIAEQPLSDKATSVMFFRNSDNHSLVVIHSNQNVEIFELNPTGLHPCCRITVDFRIVAASYSEGVLALGGEDETKKGRLALFDMATRELRADAYGHDEMVTALALDTRACRLVTGSADDKVRLFPVSGRLKLEQPAIGEHTADVSSVEFEKRNGGVISASLDSTAVIWDPKGTELVKRMRFEHSAPVVCFSQSGNGHWLATGGGKEVRLWSTLPLATSRVGQLVAVLPQRLPVAMLALSEGQLYSLGWRQEGTVTSLRTGGAVEGRTWQYDKGDGERVRLRSDLELVSAWGLDRTQLEPLDPAALRKLWENRDSTNKSSMARHKEAFFAATTAGRWDAAKFHLSNWRASAPDGFRRSSSPDFRFAESVAVALRDPDLILDLLDNLQDGLLPAQLQIRKGVAQIQLARAGIGMEKKNRLKEAKEIFEALTEKEPGVLEHTIRLAEIEVVGENTQNAVNVLLKAKKVFTKDRERESISQRLSALYLLQKNKDTIWNDLMEEYTGIGEKKCPVDPEQSTGKEEQPTGGERTLFQQIVNPDNSEAEEKSGAVQTSTRMMWALALNPAMAPRINKQLGLSADQGDPPGKSSYAALNTQALAYLRAGETSKALERIRMAIEDYETRRDPLDPASNLPGRPVDWIVEALIILSEAKSSPSGATKIEDAQKRIDAAKKRIANPESFTEWRATWNILDVKILVQEAENVIKDIQSKSTR